MQLPPPTVERALNQRYGANVEAPLTPSNPPAAVVYLEGDFTANPKPKSGDVAQMAQKNMLFAPDLIAVRTGGAVEFPNLDDTYHNVFSYSKAKRFDLGRYRKDEKPGTVVFDKPGVVTVHCEIHDRMRGTVLVLETPYFQKTDSAGHYRLGITSSAVTGADGSAEYPSKSATASVASGVDAGRSSSAIDPAKPSSGPPRRRRPPRRPRRRGRRSPFAA